MTFRLVIPVFSILLLLFTGCQKRPIHTTNLPSLNPTVGNEEGYTLLDDGTLGDGLPTYVEGDGSLIGGEIIDSGDSFLTGDNGGGSDVSTNEKSFVPGDIDTETLAVYSIYFGFDSSAIRSSEFQNLTSVFDYLVQNPDKQIRLEGHCDERGTAAYNMALGQSRASSAREYLIDAGIDPNRLTTLSWGEEKLASLGQTESDHALNRRVQFVIVY